VLILMPLCASTRASDLVRLIPSCVCGGWDVEMLCNEAVHRCHQLKGVCELLLLKCLPDLRTLSLPDACYVHGHDVLEVGL
jgi:hypothetical protein